MRFVELARGLVPKGTMKFLLPFNPGNADKPVEPSVYTLEVPGRLHSEKFRKSRGAFEAALLSRCDVVNE